MVENKKKEGTEHESNVVYVGNKPPMNYVTAVMTVLSSSDLSEVVLKARGNAISRAVDTAEITRNRFMKNAEVKSIIIATEVVTNEDGRKSNVSSMEITLTIKKSEK